MFDIKESVKDLLRWLYWYPFRFLVQHIPFRITFSLAQLFGIIAYRIFTQENENLGQLLQERHAKNNGQSITKRALINRYQNEFEELIFPTLSADNIDSLVTYKGLKNLDDALALDRGVMLMFAHFGANKMIMPAIGYKGYTMSQLSAPPTVWKEKMPHRRFSRMAERGLGIRWSLDLSLPVTHINIFSSLKKAFHCLKRNEILGVAIDGGGGEKRITVDFLGKRAVFSTGAMNLAVRTGCVVLPTFILRKNDFRHTLIIEEPLQLSGNSETHEEAVKEYLILFLKRLEWYVCRYPCHYLSFITFRQYMAKISDDPFLILKG